MTASTENLIIETLAITRRQLDDQNHKILHLTELVSKSIKTPIRWVTREQAAEMCRCNPQMIDKYLKDGKLDRSFNKKVAWNHKLDSLRHIEPAMAV